MKTNIKPKQLFLNHFRSIAWRIRRASLALTLCLFGFLLPAQGQDPMLTNIKHPMDTNVSVGATVSFRVYASSTNPPMTYQWQHDGTNLSNATNWSLVITNITVAHAGGYQATVWNASRESTNTRMAICIVDPTFTKIMTGVIVTDAEGSVSGNWADYDKDGYPDLFVANSSHSGTTRNTLYHNNGGTNFSRVAASPFTTDLMKVWSAAWIDYDNDGNVDLIAANLDGGILAQRLYRNNGGGSFTAVVDSGLRSDMRTAACPWWFDYDNDGFLDLFMTKGIYGTGAANDCLFRNNGDGTFRKMTAAEVGPMLSDQSESFVCFSADYDNDGRQELSVAHEFPPVAYNNITWRYQADGTFVETTPIGIASSFGMRFWGDYDNDGWLDAFCFSDYDGQMALFHNLGVGGFTNVTTALHVTRPVGVGYAAWGDYDNDGWLDLFYTGYYGSPTNTGNGLFHNNRDGTFTQILNGSPVYDGGRRVTPSWTDYDNDGFLDLFIAVGNADPAKNLLYRNNGNTNHWLTVKLDGRASNRSGIGARVRAQATINGQPVSQMREISCENALAGQNGLLAHFGLGDATKVDTLTIEWPSGIMQEWKDVAVDQHLTKVESQNLLLQPPQFTASSRAADGTFQATATCAATNALCVLEASTNLVQWTKLSVRANTTGTMQFDDPGATNRPTRFYRVVVP